ncbi:ABC transporter ATP-binding protein [Brachybacterium phenoliresistens]|uniref:ABC transporter ATP-binding protein n=1 Tax=Brachybacterium phenoliresistens TaxID=396014 RepID=UPI0031E1B777
MIRFESVQKRYPGGTVAVEDFSCTIPSHTATVLVGSSGSGKTTLLRMINRMVDPSAGRVLIDDQDVATTDKVALRRSIGYVMQASGLLPHRTVQDNVATVPMLTGTPKREARAAALDLLETVGLDRGLATRYPSQLSGGQQQRVGVARALASDPNILLMDEPFGAVDPIVRGELQTELLRLQSELGKTIVFVTHDIDEAFLIGDQVVILRPGGEVAQAGTAEEILAAPADDFVERFIGADRGRRALRLEERDGTRIVVDGTGRAAGVLQAAEGDLAVPDAPARDRA